MAKQQPNSLDLVRLRQGWFPRGWTPVPTWPRHGNDPERTTVAAITTWCGAADVPGEFLWHPDLLGVAFSDPDAALAFKMRWA